MQYNLINDSYLPGTVGQYSIIFDTINYNSLYITWLDRYVIIYMKFNPIHVPKIDENSYQNMVATNKCFF